MTEDAFWEMHEIPKFKSKAQLVKELNEIKRVVYGAKLYEVIVWEMFSHRSLMRKLKENIMDKTDENLMDIAIDKDNRRELAKGINPQTGGYHTMADCKCKVEGIKTLLEQIRRHTKDTNSTAWAVSDSAIQMCDELLVEGKNGMVNKG
jgi:ribosomal protein S6